MGQAQREESAADAVSVDGAARTEIDPWAPGGAMSIGWVPGSAPESADLSPVGPTVSPAGHDDPGLTAPTAGSDTTPVFVGGVGATETGVAARPRGEQVQASGRRVRSHNSPLPLVAAVVVVAVAVGVGIGISSRDLDGDDAGAGNETSSVLTELAAPAAAGGGAQMPSAPTMTGVGPISWVRVDGDDASLPLRAAPLAADVLVGTDDTTRRWTSDDGGLTWSDVDRVTVEREVGGVDWVLRLSGAETSLWQADGGGGVRPAEVDVASAASRRADGYAIRTEIDADDRPIAIAGESFLPLRVRAELPWAEILGSSPGRPFRVEVDVDGRWIRAVAGDFHELPVTRLALSDTGSGRVELRDADDVAVWSFVPPAADDELSTAHVITGLPITMWARWDGDSFRRLETPWRRTDRVDVAATGDGVVARAVGLDRRARLWRSTDGVAWADVRLPVEPSEGTPVGLVQGADEVIVTAFDRDRPVKWTTRDGLAFEELPDVPGIERRARGSFGWVAPPPRSEPQIRISADGVDWEVVDLRSMLELDASRWDVGLTVTVVGSEIFVAVDRPVGRTLLIGTVG